ncbi:MAG TPA: helix-turn-helix domain-containing protein, partial [Longimicrobiales bacterium]
SLEEAVARGRFREDLFYRLDAFRITLPPLRARASDVEVLARHFLRTIAAELNQTPKFLAPETFEMVMRHEWRGNVRELKNVMERAYVVCDGPEILPHHLTLQRRGDLSAAAAPNPDLAGQISIPKHGMTIEDIEREAIMITLRTVDGNQSKAARILGISRATLLRKLQKYASDGTIDISAVA